MAFKLSITVFIACFTSCVLASPVLPVSYITDINVAYKNGTWICGPLNCPVDTFGCHVQRLTNRVDQTILDNTYTCYNANNKVLAVDAFTTNMYQVKHITIDLKTYEGAQTIYKTGYSLGNNEYAYGIVNLDDWPQLKTSAARNIMSVEGSNGNWNDLEI